MFSVTLNSGILNYYSIQWRARVKTNSSKRILLSMIRLWTWSQDSLYDYSSRSTISWWHYPLKQVSESGFEECKTLACPCGSNSRKWIRRAEVEHQAENQAGLEGERNHSSRSVSRSDSMNTLRAWYLQGIIQLTYFLNPSLFPFLLDIVGAGGILQGDHGELTTPDYPEKNYENGVVFPKFLKSLRVGNFLGMFVTWCW